MEMVKILIAALWEQAEEMGFEQIQKVIWKTAVNAIKNEIFQK